MLDTQQSHRFFLELVVLVVAATCWYLIANGYTNSFIQLLLHGAEQLPQVFGFCHTFVALFELSLILFMVAISY